MTILAYVLKTGVATSKELIDYKKVDPSGFSTFLQWAREQAANENIEITEK